MTYIVFDLETVIDRERIERSEPGPFGFDGYMDRLRESTGKDDPFVPWIYHRPVALAGVKVGATSAKSFVLTEPAAGEAPLLSATIAGSFWRGFNARRPIAITWNGRGFDFPVLEAEALRLGLNIGGWFRPPGTKSWEDPRGRFSGFHIDLMDWVANAGAAQRPSLNAMAAALGVPGKLGVSGADVEALWAEGKVAEIAAYCAADAMTTLAVAVKIAAASDALPGLTADAIERAAEGFAAIGDECAASIRSWLDVAESLKPGP